jgi:hypothetical protein
MPAAIAAATAKAAAAAAFNATGRVQRRLNGAPLPQVRWPKVVGLQVRMLRHKPSIEAFADRFVSAAVHAATELSSSTSTSTSGGNGDEEALSGNRASAKVVLVVATIEKRALQVIQQDAKRHGNLPVVVQRERDDHQAFDADHTARAAVDLLGLAVSASLRGRGL